MISTTEILAHMPGHSRVWVYMADRELTPANASVIQAATDKFCAGWAAHGARLSAAGEVVQNRFLILAVDERMAGASGCSIDKSLHFIQLLEQQFGLSFTNRLLLAKALANGMEVFSLAEVESLVMRGHLQKDDLIFDNHVNTLHDLRSRWLKPLQDTWLRRFWPAKTSTPVS